MYDETPIKQQQPDAEKLSELLAAFVHRLEKKAEERVMARKPIEQRMLEDLRMFHGMYDEATIKRLSDKKKSQVFMNVTRPKTNTVIARLWDLLFPTDDRNWSISATPVPEMDRIMEDRREIADAARLNMEAAQRAMDAANEAQDPAGMDAAREQMNEAQAILEEAEQEADRLQEIKRAANAKANLMMDEIDDQLKACRYGAEARDMITDGCKLGTGVIKSPVVSGKRRRRFAETEAGFQLIEESDNTPAAQWVDPWAFFPDPTTFNPSDGDGVFERHLLNETQMRKLQMRDDIDIDALREVMRGGPKNNNAPWYLTELVNLTHDKTTVVSDCWTVWEYTGEISGEDLKLLANAFETARDEYEIAKDDAGEIDPLFSMQARIWFCEGKILSFALHPLDSEACIYSIWNFERAEHGPWGYGVPFIMRHEQVTINSAKRMIMDNGALSSGPQVVVNKSLITPEDGDWNLVPNKVWQWQPPEEGSPITEPFKVYPIQANLGDLAGIIDLAKKTIDEITIPAIAQGEEGAQRHGTFQGLALLMNGANVGLRRLVRDFDDQVTTPVIRNFYEWNMQFSPKEQIKGDYEVEARGSSVLLVREMQASNLMMIADRFGDHPRYGPLLHHSAIMELIFRALMVPTAEITKTEREVEEEMRRAQEQPSPEAMAQQAQIDIKNRELELREMESNNKVQIANMEADSRRYVADRSFDAIMERIAVQFNLSREELEAKWKAEMQKLEAHRADKQQEREAKERSLATEVAMRERTGKSAGGLV